MKKDLLMLGLGLAAGVYLGYQKEDELEAMYRKSKKARRKMMKKVHAMEDGFSEYLDWK